MDTRLRKRSLMSQLHIYNNMHSVMMRNYICNIYIYIYSCIYLHSRAICMPKSHGLAPDLPRLLSTCLVTGICMTSSTNSTCTRPQWLEKEPRNFLMSIQKYQIYLDILQKYYEINHGFGQTQLPQLTHAAPVAPLQNVGLFQP